MTPRTEAPAFKVSKEKQIVNVEVPLVKNTHWEQWVYCFSDQHFDSVHCDRDLLSFELEKALKRKAIILSGGDWFDVICASRDPRGTKSELRAEYKKSDYFSAIIDDTVNYLDRYAENIAIMIHGNHETGCIKKNELDLTNQVVTRLNDRMKSQIHKGEYEEFLRLSFISPRNEKDKDNKYSKLFYMNHGWGGASPVTGGTIHHARVAEFVKADFVLMGHLHTQQLDSRTFWEVTNKDTILEKKQNFIRTGSFKKGRMPGETTWETVKGIKPKPRGGTWLRFHWNTTHRGGNIECDIMQSA